MGSEMEKIVIDALEPRSTLEIVFSIYHNLDDTYRELIALTGVGVVRLLAQTGIHPGDRTTKNLSLAVVRKQGYS